MPGSHYIHIFLPISHPEIVDYSFVKDTTIVNEGLSHLIIDVHENAMIGSCQNMYNVNVQFTKLISQFPLEVIYGQFKVTK